jgi:hypothetical protein
MSFGLAPIKQEGMAIRTWEEAMGVSSGGSGAYGTVKYEKPKVNTKELVLEWIMTYGEAPVKLDAFMQKNPSFGYIDDKYLDVNEDTEEYALNEFAKSLLAE